MRTVLTLAVLIAACDCGFAETPNADIPPTLLGFFKPGMLVGIQSIDGSAQVFVHAYSKENYSVARSISQQGRRAIDARELAKQNESVRAALTQHLATSDAPKASAGEVWIMPLMRMTLGRVQAVGKDYVFIETDDKTPKRIVIRDSCVSRVYLDANPIRFFSRSTRDRSSIDR